LETPSERLGRKRHYIFTAYGPERYRQFIHK
jgi:hypothetical protein